MAPPPWGSSSPPATAPWRSTRWSWERPRRIHGQTWGTGEDWRMMIWLVVDPTLWKIWLRQLGWHFQLDGKAKKLFQSTNHGEYHGESLVSGWPTPLVVQHSELENDHAITGKIHYVYGHFQYYNGFSGMFFGENYGEYHGQLWLSWDNDGISMGKTHDIVYTSTTGSWLTYPSGNETYSEPERSTMLLMGKSTMSMVIFK